MKIIGVYNRFGYRVISADGEEELYPVIGPEIVGFRWKFNY